MDQTVKDVKIIIILIHQQTSVFLVVVILLALKVYNVQQWASVNVSQVLKDRIVIVVLLTFLILARLVAGELLFLGLFSAF